MSSVFGLRPHEAVLAAVGLSLAEWAQGPLAWDLEGHGRQPFAPSIDLSRSIGWFPTRYHIVLAAHPSDMPAWHESMKEEFTPITAPGLPDGLLNYGATTPFH